MRILVVEDKLKHQDSARRTLDGHDLTVVTTYDAALDLMKRDKLPLPFDVALLDLMMPMSPRTLAGGVYDPAKQEPYGFVLALRAASLGIPKIAVVTDTNHHKGAMSAALDVLGYCRKGDRDSDWNCYWRDELRPNFTINGAACMFVHAPFIDDEAKDWGKVLAALTATG
jgi:CheY-like chemotaxis protein